MKLLISCLLILLANCVFAQQSYLRPPAEQGTEFDSTLFPPKAYVRVVSYSFNRDTSISWKMVRELTEEYEKFRNIDSVKAWSFIEESEILIGKLYAVGKGIIQNDSIAQDAQMIKTLSKVEIDSLINLFAPPPPPPPRKAGDPIVEGEPDSNCLPTYRDALVFYDHNNQVVGTIDLCFGCLQDHFSNNRNYYLKYAQLAAIKSFFKNTLGHPVDLRPY